jgi:dTMP kinase
VSLFITFEGPDGSGKSTQIERLADYLSRRGHQVECTREPGGTLIGERIREILHDAGHVEMAGETEILLYSASRAQLVAQSIRPLLAAGSIVLCDRYADSTYAYQGFGRGFDLSTLQYITHFATGGLQPDLVIYLDLPVEEGLARKQQANAAGEGEWNRMDRLTLDFHRRARDGYLSLAQAAPHQWHVIDARQPEDQVHQVICEVARSKNL